MEEPVDKDQEKDIEEAVRQFVDEKWQGRQPNIDEFVKQYPQLEHQIRQRILDVQKIDILFDSLVHADKSDFEGLADGQNLVGQKIGSFEIVEVIGSGGMGIVYLARDTRLNRSVAIKSVPAQLKDDSKARICFKREAELLASLNHPNIAVIYDIIEQEDGTGYLVLEYVPGETLTERIARGPLELEEALSIGRQIAEAVSEAHKNGIIHRDLKPGNIKLTPERRVKVLDFGLAKPSVSKDTDIHITSTEPGHIIGTPAYMSPEQARGQDTDHRTDIWSFGCILYQMLTGTIPFEGQTATDILAKIIERQPDWKLLSQEIPANIHVLLQNCLEKDPNKRLRDIKEAIIVIRETLSKPLIAPASKLRKIAMILSAVAVCIVLLGIALKFIPQKQNQPQINQIRLVVLPFENLGPDDDEYFADGITDAITARLSAIHGLGVISRQSAMQYKNIEKSPQQIAQELCVDYILEGTVQREQPSDPNSKVRIIPQLIRISDDTHVWAQPYEDDMRRIFQVQSEVAEQVAQGLNITLLEPERQVIRSEPTTNKEAYEYYLQGNEYFNRSSNNKDDLEIAINLYDRAVKLDPKFALAFTQLSIAHSQMYWYYDRSDTHHTLAKDAVDEAFQLNPELSEAHRALGFYLYWCHLNYDQALKEFDIARKSLPNDSLLLAGIAYIQRRRGNFEKAATTLEKVLELSPRDIGAIGNLGETFMLMGKYRQAEIYRDRFILLTPDQSVGYASKAMLYLSWQGNVAKARTVMLEALQNIKAAEEDPFIREQLVDINVYEQNYQKALDLLYLKQEYIDTGGRFIPNVLRLAQIYGYMKKDELSKKYYNEAHVILESKIVEDPEDERVHSSLGIAFAGLGEKQKAIMHGEKAVALLPVSKDAMRGVYRIEELALIYVMVEKHDEAIDTLKYLLDVPGQLSIPLLKIDPDWNPLREHSRFIELLESVNSEKLSKTE